MTDQTDKDPDRIGTAWMPDRPMVAAHAHNAYTFLRGIEADDDETGKRDMLLIGYGSVEGGIRMIVDVQGREAALSLMAEYVRAIKALKDEPPMPSAILN